MRAPFTLATLLLSFQWQAGVGAGARARANPDTNHHRSASRSSSPSSSPSTRPRTIQRDVIIIGGGAAGVYGATQLRKQGKSLVVIEKAAEFGGHTATYRVPGTDNETIDYGVQVYDPVAGSLDIVYDFFGAYDVPLETYVPARGTTRYLDFARNFTALPDGFAAGANLTAYAAQVARFPFLRDFGTASPTPFPEDLLLPFGDFVDKYGLGDIVYYIHEQAAGLGDLLGRATYYVLWEFGTDFVDSLDGVGPGGLTTVHRDNQEPYLRAQAAFGADSLVSSAVTSASRTDEGVTVTVTVSTPNGTEEVVVVEAPKLLVAMPPTEDNMAPLDLDTTEADLFSRFVGTGWYQAIVNVTGLPSGLSFLNAGASTPYHLPALPSVYEVYDIGYSPGVYLTRFASNGSVPVETVMAAMVDAVEQIRVAVIGEEAAAGLPPAEVLGFADHYPYALEVPTSELADGFYDKLAALQGHRSTWYTGATFFGPSSPEVWNATGMVLDWMFS